MANQNGPFSLSLSLCLLAIDCCPGIFQNVVLPPSPLILPSLAGLVLICCVDCGCLDAGEPLRETGAEAVHGPFQVVVLNHQVEVALLVTK